MISPKNARISGDITRELSRPIETQLDLIKVFPTEILEWVDLTDVAHGGSE